MAQDSLNRFYWPSLMMFGPHDSESAPFRQIDAMEDQARNQRRPAPEVHRPDRAADQFLGLEHPDKEIRWNEQRQHYDHGEIDWDEFNAVINGNGHCKSPAHGASYPGHEEGHGLRGP